VRLQADITISTKLTSITASGSGSAELYSYVSNGGFDMKPSLTVDVSANATVSIDASVQIGMEGGHLTGKAAAAPAAAAAAAADADADAAVAHLAAVLCRSCLVVASASGLSAG
jgi:hypothetical protein